MKHLKTLITLFLLLIGTGVSWAEFKDFEIDLMHETVTLPDGVTATNDGQNGPYYNGGHGWANYVFAFTTNESFKLTLQKCYYGGDACIKVGNAKTGEVVATLNTKQTEANCDGQVSCVYESDGTEKTFYVLCGPYCHYAKVEKVGGDTPKPQKFGFSIDLMQENVTLPDGVTSTYVPGATPWYNGTHGWANYVFGFTTNKSFKLTLQKCYYGGDAYIRVGSPTTEDYVAKLNTKQNETNCNGEVSCVYESDGTEKTFYVLCGPYCHFAKVEEVETAAHIHSFSGDWEQTPTHHYHKCTAEGCDIDYKAVPAELANYVKYGAHNYKTTVTLPTYYTCTVCGYVNETLKEDADAVNAVIALISNIGEVAGTDESYAKIDAARKAYEMLSEERQELVLNYETLIDAETMYKALAPIDVAERAFTWDWKNADETDQIVQETMIDGNVGEIHSDIAGLSLEVDASGGGSFKAQMAGDVHYAILMPGATIKVPVRRMGDKVYITFPGGQTDFNIGEIKGINYDKNKGYTATESDASNGYVSITSTAKNGRGSFVYSIGIVQKPFNAVLPMITLNSAGWASFTSLVRGYVCACPLGAKAYVATAVDDESVTLTEVTHFTYGEGVFIKGEPFAELFANVVEAESTYPHSNNLTVGCPKDIMLFPESNAYVVATNKTTKVSGFYRVNTAVNVPAGKAYLYAPTVKSKAKSLKIKFADGAEATGIESVLTDVETKEPTVFYNLSGQVVGKDYKGIVIGNDGKKYVK